MLFTHILMMEVSPAGGHGVVQTPNGDKIVQPNGHSYYPIDIDMSTKVPTTTSLTPDILVSNPTVPHGQLSNNNKVIETNNYNGITNNHYQVSTLHANIIDKNGIAFGTGLHATPDQIVLGNFNKKKFKSHFSGWCWI